jgi:ribosomal protein S18 acetylase RimI-like enzyme
MIEYTESIEGVTPDQLDGFFVDAGWPAYPSPETHLRLLQSSDHAVLAIDRDADTVAGFVTAISDGVLSAYIPLLEVRGPYQGRGVGTELMRRMLARLGGYYMVDLLCDPEMQPFYRRLGMRPATGMMLRNYDRQAGRASGERRRLPISDT